jgi:hypothetical protein
VVNLFSVARRAALQGDTKPEALAKRSERPLRNGMTPCYNISRTECQRTEPKPWLCDCRCVPCLHKSSPARQRPSSAPPKKPASRVWARFMPIVDRSLHHQGVHSSEAAAAPLSYAPPSAAAPPCQVAPAPTSATAPRCHLSSEPPSAAPPHCQDQGAAAAPPSVAPPSAAAL